MMRSRPCASRAACSLGLVSCIVTRKQHLIFFAQTEPNIDSLSCIHADGPTSADEDTVRVLVLRRKCAPSHIIDDCRGEIAQEEVLRLQRLRMAPAPELYVGKGFACGVVMLHSDWS